MWCQHPNDRVQVLLFLHKRVFGVNPTDGVCHCAVLQPCSWISWCLWWHLSVRAQVKNGQIIREHITPTENGSSGEEILSDPPNKIRVLPRARVQVCQDSYWSIRLIYDMYATAQPRRGIYRVQGPVCSLPYQAPAGMENLTVNKPARCFCTCREGAERRTGPTSCWNAACA